MRGPLNLRSRFTDGPNKMAIQRKFPARMHAFQLFDDRVQLIHKHSSSCRALTVVNVGRAGHIHAKLVHDPMMPCG